VNIAQWPQLVGGYPTLAALPCSSGLRSQQPIGFGGRAGQIDRTSSRKRLTTRGWATDTRGPQGASEDRRRARRRGRRGPPRVEGSPEAIGVNGPRRSPRLLAGSARESLSIVSSSQTLSSVRSRSALSSIGEEDRPSAVPVLIFIEARRRASSHPCRTGRGSARSVSRFSWRWCSTRAIRRWSSPPMLKTVSRSTRSAKRVDLTLVLQRTPRCHDSLRNP
jgi:hypothetical protein